MRLAVITGMRASLLGLMVALSVAGAGRQPSEVVITVTDAMTQRPLANAHVQDLLSGQHRITNEQGEAIINWPAEGRLRLRVRQLGYNPLMRTILRDGSPELRSFALNRVAYVVSPVQSTSRCVIDADSTWKLLSVSALEQLRQAAEKYAEFRNAYPFAAKVERRTAQVPQEGEIRTVTAKKEFYRSDDLEQTYHPGQVVRHGSRAMNVPVLFLSTLADSAFWESHCYIVRDVEPFQGTRALRLDFSPDSSITGPDWQGSALIDSATSYLLRVDFSIVNLGKYDTPRRFEGYTTFSSPSPFVIMPDSNFAQWWIWKHGDNDEWGKPDYIQGLYIQELVYRKGKPPGYQPPL